MNRTCHLLLICLVVWPAVVFSAPVGNIGDTTSLFRDEPTILFVTSFTADQQKNTFPEQITRFPWTNPIYTPPEERHYLQLRQSKTTMNTLGAKVGLAMVDKGAVYGLVGTTNTTLDLYYEDWTVERYFSLTETIESGPDLYYGLGITMVLHQGEYRTKPFTFGMDLSYRRLTIEDDRLDVASEQIYYYSVLDEIQLAFCLSLDLNRWSPYVGAKVASITGTEEYINRLEDSDYYDEGYIHYEEDITWFKNIGFVAGVTTFIFDGLSLGFEVRFGDEQGMGVSATTSF